MRILILLGSPNPAGCTAELCKPLRKELNTAGVEFDYIALARKSVEPCLGCSTCQNAEGAYGCPQQDDMQDIAEKIIAADCVVLACPIYTWYCPTAMKSVLDRTYGLSKNYGTAKNSLWAGKKIALLMTHGYDHDYACTPFETGIECLCKHAGLEYLGSYSVRDVHGKSDMKTPEAVEGVKAFTKMILRSIGWEEPSLPEIAEDVFPEAVTSALPKTSETTAEETDLPDLPDEVYYSVLELLSYAQATGFKLDGESTVPAVKHVCRLADHGDNDARFLAARYYITNSDDDRDLQRAVTWLELAVQAGHKGALNYYRSLQSE